MRAASYIIYADYGQWNPGLADPELQWASTRRSPLPMLFLLIMEPLQKLFERAASQGILSPLAPHGLEQRLSIFADDVMLFLKPLEMDIACCNMLLQIFGMASGLQTNLQKSAAIPVGCSHDQINLASATLHCAVGHFACKYLGMPLSLRKPSAAQLQGLVDHLAARLPTWRDSALPKSGRLLLVLSVLSAMPLHSMMALDLPIKTINAMNKIIRGFLWCGQKEAKGGNCSVAWSAVCTPK